MLPRAARDFLFGLLDMRRQYAGSTASLTRPVQGAHRSFIDFLHFLMGQLGHWRGIQL
jgi:hypothetical protein